MVKKSLSAKIVIRSSRDQIFSKFTSEPNIQGYQIFNAIFVSIPLLTSKAQKSIFQRCIRIKLCNISCCKTNLSQCIFFLRIKEFKSINQICNLTVQMSLTACAEFFYVQHFYVASKLAELAFQWFQPKSFNGFNHKTLTWPILKLHKSAIHQKNICVPTPRSARPYSLRRGPKAPFISFLCAPRLARPRHALRGHAVSGAAQKPHSFHFYVAD